MDDKHFDRLSRLFGSGATRRGLLGMAAALTGLALTDTEAGNKRRRRRRRRKKDDGPGGGIPPTNFCCRFQCLDGTYKSVCLANQTSCDCRCAHVDGCSFDLATQVASCDTCGAA